MFRRPIPKGTAMIDVGLYVGVEGGSKVGLLEGTSITHFASKIGCFCWILVSMLFCRAGHFWSALSWGWGTP